MPSSRRPVSTDTSAASPLITTTHTGGTASVPDNRAHSTGPHASSRHRK
jgi:hypothetical protein